MKTQENELFPEITWEKNDVSENHGHVIYYNCSGKDLDGNEYLGIWVEINGEFDEIVEIDPK
jgi:hypothetical protein